MQSALLQKLQECVCDYSFGKRKNTNLNVRGYHHHVPCTEITIWLE